ncbi:MAG: hypothetical protein HQ541_01995 [Mariniphaga sp.]|nr:hypothetical protein [Mariniphaga sp.]
MKKFKNLKHRIFRGNDFDVGFSQYFLEGDNSPTFILNEKKHRQYPEKLIFEDKKYRTTKMNEVINLILSNNNGFGRMAIKKGQQNCQPFLSGSPDSWKLQPKF